MSRILNLNSKQHKQQFVLLNSCLWYNCREPYTLHPLKNPTHVHKKSTHTYTHKNKRKKHTQIKNKITNENNNYKKKKSKSYLYL